MNDVLAELLEGKPVWIDGRLAIRVGDEVLVMDRPPDMLGGDSFRDHWRRSRLRCFDYRCPFDFLTEFDNWFRWKSRQHFRRDRTGDIIVDMISDLERIQAHQLPDRIRFMTEARFGIAPPPTGLTRFVT